MVFAYLATLGQFGKNDCGSDNACDSICDAWDAVL